MPSATVLYERLMRRMFMLAGARSLRVPFERGSLHVLDLQGGGSLPALVLLHGFSASGASQYGAMARHLRGCVSRIVLPDLPGHGLSSVPARLDDGVMLAGLEAALGGSMDAPFVLFASSMAGGLGVRYALAHPERVRGLMLCSPGGAPIAPHEIDAFVRRFRIKSHRDALDFVDRLFPAGHPLRHAYAFGVRQQFNRPHLVRLLERMRDLEFLSPDELRALRVPVHLIWGKHDYVLPSSHFDFYRNNLPPCTEVETPTAFGHAPFLHQADQVAARLIAFARRVTAVDRPRASR